VTLVGPTGNPRWHRWVKGPAGFLQAGGGDRVCMVQAFALSMLDLCPDPMTDRYRLRAELRQLDVNGRSPDRRLPTGGVYDFGLYFGRRSASGADGWQTETCLAVRLTETPKESAGKAKLGRVLVIESPTRAAEVSESNVARASFPVLENLPGPWRVIEIEVSPDGVRAQLGNLDGIWVAFTPLEALTVRKYYEGPHPALDRLAPGHGVVPPLWTPRAALGGWTFSSAIAIRNMTVTPLK